MDPTQPKYMKLLQTLLQEGEMNFEQLANVIHNRNATRYRLDSLIEAGIIRDLRTQVRKGQTARFVLTDNGERIALDYVFANVEKSLSQISSLLSRLKGRDHFRQLRDFLHQDLIKPDEYALLKDKSPDEVLKSDVVQTFKERSAKRGLLTENLKTIHDLFIKASMRSEFQGKQYFVGFTKEGWPDLIEEQTLRRWLHEAALWRKERGP